MVRGAENTYYKFHGAIKEISEINSYVLVQSVTFAFKCPLCGHSHFEILGFSLYRCFMCSATFKRRELKKK